MNAQRLAGAYLLGFEPMFISVDGDEIRIRLIGVPEELAAHLVDNGDAYVIRGSQLEGGTLEFAEGDPAPGGKLGGVIDFVRTDEVVEDIGGRGLHFVAGDWEPDEEEAYRELRDRILAIRDGGPIDWTLPWPKWRFIAWLSDQSHFIFHGSPRPDLDLFAPKRSSVEIMDQGGTGNRAAVYGTPYGLWAMWFAVIDRSKLKGSIRNGVMRWHDRSGRGVDLYRFTVHKDLVGGDIWRTGTLYFLPREAFEPIAYYPGGPLSNEWAAPVALIPLARLTTDPDDFPFRDQVGGHDDSELIAAEEVGDVVTSKVTSARRIPGAMIVSLDWDEEVAGVWDQYVATRQRFTPDVTRHLTMAGHNRATMEVRGPGGFLQAYEAALTEAGVEVVDSRQGGSEGS